MPNGNDDDWTEDGHTCNQNLEVKDENGKVIGHMCSSCGAST